MTEALVNKIGGTSAGSPEHVANLVQNPEGTFIPVDYEGRDPSMVLVVSAIGGIDGDPRRVTSMTKQYADSVAVGRPDNDLRDHIIARHEEVYGNLDDSILHPLIDDLAKDLKPAEDRIPFHYVSLGEEYSGRLMAAALGGQYLPPEHITFRGSSYDLAATVNNLRKAQAAGIFDSSRPTIYPGFFGFNELGGRRLLDKGGSDRTMAALAIGLGAKVTGKWSDIEGIHTADPRHIDDTVIRPTLTLAEIREYALGGNPVLNGRTPLDFDQYGWDGSIVIRSTFSPDEAGTMITPARRAELDQPVAAIAGRSVDMISIIDLGMAHKVGYVSHATHRAEELGLSISHFPAGNDALTFVIDPDSSDVFPNESDKKSELDHEEKIAALEAYLQAEAISPNARITVEKNRALLVLVGEALRVEKVRTLTNARFNLAALRGGITVRDTIGNIQSPSLIFDVTGDELREAQAVAHAEFISSPLLRDIVSIPTSTLKRLSRDFPPSA